MTRLKTDRLIIREFRDTDRRPLRAILGDPRVMTYSVNGPMDDADVARFIAACRQSYRSDGLGQWALVERASRRLVGFCGLSHLELDGRAEVEIGYRLAHDRWGRGLATEAGTAVLERGFAQWRLESVVAIIAREHLASQNVARKLGMAFHYATQYHGWEVAIYRCRASGPA